MGIHRLVQYVRSSAHQCRFFQHVSHGRIYVSKVVYVDITHKLLEIYLAHQHITDVTMMMNVVVNELTSFLQQLQYYEQQIYVFIDKRMIYRMPKMSMIFSDFLIRPLHISRYERALATPMIHQRYLEQLASGSNFDEIYPEVRNMFELTSIYASVTPCVNEYISLVYCKKILGYAVDALIEHGWHRYLMLRAAKREVSTQRHMRLRYGYLENGIIDGRKSLNRELYSCSRGDISILSSIAAHIPYNLLIYAMDEISSRITSNMPNVIFFGCEFEADFAIVSHIRKYSRNILPTIYTNDTDLIALLSDIHCIVRMEDGKKTIVVDPARLFSSIFGERMLSSRVIRILCVLQGTDYNPYNAASPIHLQSLTDKGWYMLDEDALLLRVYRVMRRYPESIYIRQTALAMNIYLHGEARLESMLHVLGVGEHVCEKNIDRFLHIVNRNMFV